MLLAKWLKLILVDDLFYKFVFEKVHLVIQVFLWFQDTMSHFILQLCCPYQTWVAMTNSLWVVKILIFVFKNFFLPPLLQGLPFHLNILLDWSSPVLFFLHENLYLWSYEKQPVYEACNRKLKLSTGPSEVELHQHRAVWKLFWIHLKCFCVENSWNWHFYHFQCFLLWSNRQFRTNLKCFHFWP